MNECCKEWWPRFRSWHWDLRYDTGIKVKEIVLPCGHRWKICTHDYRYDYWQEVGQMKLPLKVAV